MLIKDIVEDHLLPVFKNHRKAILASPLFLGDLDRLLDLLESATNLLSVLLNEEGLLEYLLSRYLPIHRWVFFRNGVPVEIDYRLFPLVRRCRDHLYEKHVELPLNAIQVLHDFILLRDNIPHDQCIVLVNTFDLG